MNENPDNKNIIGLGPDSKLPDTDMSSRYLIPTPGMLRYIDTDAPNRVLQQYQWSAEAGIFDWYDIPLVLT